MPQFIRSIREVCSSGGLAKSLALTVHGSTPRRIDAIPGVHQVCIMQYVPHFTGEFRTKDFVLKVTFPTFQLSQ